MHGGILGIIWICHNLHICNEFVFLISVFLKKVIKRSDGTIDRSVLHFYKVESGLIRKDVKKLESRRNDISIKIRKGRDYSRDLKESEVVEDFGFVNGQLILNFFKS